MSGFNGRRPSNVSQYVANLNAIPSAHDVALQQQQQQEGFSLDDDLAMFTNTEFFDFDLGDSMASASGSSKELDFLNGRHHHKNWNRSDDRFFVLTLTGINRWLPI